MTEIDKEALECWNSAPHDFPNLLEAMTYAFKKACSWQRERDAETARALFKSPPGGNTYLEIVGNGIAEAILKAT